MFVLYSCCFIQRHDTIHKSVLVGTSRHNENLKINLSTKGKVNKRTIGNGTVH
jgi:hypothetical protein